MSFAMLCGPDGGIFIVVLLFFALAAALVSACIAAAVYATIALAKWAAARHNRLAARAG